MNFTSLAYFEMVARELSFTKAAQELHITQQSLSSNIAKLEQEVGCQLIVRHVPLELTYAGEVMLRYAATFREEYTAMMQEFGDIAQNQSGVLRIGVTYTRGRALLPGIIQAFQQRYPAIRIDIIENANDVLTQKLIDGEVDVAIASFPASIPGIDIQEFYQDETVMLISRDLFESIYGEKAPEIANRFEAGEYDAIEGCPLLLNSIDDISGHIERSLLKSAGFTRPRIVSTSSNTETLLDLCVRGVGACFCSEILARSTLSKKKLESLMLLRLGPTAHYQISFGRPRKSYQWSIVDAFMEVAREAVSH